MLHFLATVALLLFIGERLVRYTYAWLDGRRFARVLVAIIAVPLFGGAAAVLFSTMPGATSYAATFGALIGAIAGWFFAGWPTYYWEAWSRRIQY